MKAITFAVTFLAAIASSSAAAVDIEKRASPGLYLCENINFRGYCKHYTHGWGQCITIANDFPSGDRGVSSAGADDGNRCTLYANVACTGSKIDIYNPGLENLKVAGWNDRAKSYRCTAL